MMIEKEKIILAQMCLLMLLAIPTAHAEKYYVLTAHIAEGRAIISSIKMENVPVAIPEGDGNQIIEVVSAQQEVLYSGRYDLGISPAALYIPYDVDGNYLAIKKSTGELLQKVSVAIFSSVCGDGLCQSSENTQTCEADCPAPTPINVANQKESEEKPTEIIPDKPKTPQVETPVAIPSKKPILKKQVKKGVDTGKLILIAGILGVSMVSGGFLVALKKSKEQRLGQIRQYVQKYANYPLDQVKRSLLVRGIKEKDIEEALRQN